MTTTRKHHITKEPQSKGGKFLTSTIYRIQKTNNEPTAVTHTHTHTTREKKNENLRFLNVNTQQ